MITPVGFAQRGQTNATREEELLEKPKQHLGISPNSTVMRKWKWLFVSDWECNSLTSSDNIFKNVPICDKYIFLLRDYDYNTSEE